MKIWTIGYFPFTLGGSVHRPVACEVEVDGPHDGGNGYELYVATAPSGKTFVAEGQTGAIVGNSLKDVCEDIATGDPAVMSRQIAESWDKVANAEVLTAEKFWHMLRGA